MIRTISLAAVSAVAIAGAASAQDGSFTLGGGYSYIDVEDFNVHGVNIQGGYDFNQYFGVELEGIVGVTDEDISGVEVSVEHALGGFLVGRLPVAENADIYARLGYATAEVEAAVGGVSVSDSDEAVAYGLGGRWFFAGDNGVRVDYTRHDFDDGGEADVFGISYVRRFGG